MLVTTVSILTFMGKIFVVYQRQVYKCIKFCGYNFCGLISTSQFIFSRCHREQNSCFKVMFKVYSLTVLATHLCWHTYLGLSKPFCGVDSPQRILPAGISLRYLNKARGIYSRGEQVHVLSTGLYIARYIELIYYVH